MKESEFWQRILGRAFMLLVFVSMSLALVAVAWVLRVHVEPWPAGFGEPSPPAVSAADIPVIDERFRWSSPLQEVENHLVIRVSLDEVEVDYSRLVFQRRMQARMRVFDEGEVHPDSWMRAAWARANFHEHMAAELADSGVTFDRENEQVLELDEGRIRRDSRENSLLIRPLKHELEAARKWSARTATYLGADFEPDVILAIDHDVPASTLLPLLHTLGRSPFHGYDFLVRSDKDANSAQDLRILRYPRPKFSGGCPREPATSEHDCARVRSVLFPEGVWRFSDFDTGDDWCGARLYPESFEPASWHGKPIEIPGPCASREDSEAPVNYFLDGFDEARVCGSAVLEIGGEATTFGAFAREFAHLLGAREIEAVSLSMDGMESPEDFCEVGEHLASEPPGLRRVPSYEPLANDDASEFED